MLEKAEQDLETSKCKTKALEQIILDMGGNLPKDEEMALLAAKQQEEMERALIDA
jgi:hypothetical protein